MTWHLPYVESLLWPAGPRLSSKCSGTPGPRLAHRVFRLCGCTRRVLGSSQVAIRPAAAQDPRVSLGPGAHRAGASLFPSHLTWRETECGPHCGMRITAQKHPISSCYGPPSSGSSRVIMKPWCRCFQEAPSWGLPPTLLPAPGRLHQPSSPTLWGPRDHRRTCWDSKGGRLLTAWRPCWSWHRWLQLEGPESTSHPSLWFYRRGL